MKIIGGSENADYNNSSGDPLSKVRIPLYANVFKALTPGDMGAG